MLAEGFDQKNITKKELILTNLFNSLPTYLLHLPTTFFIIAPLLKSAAFTYIGLTLSAALLRTLLISVISRILLAKKQLELSSKKPDKLQKKLSVRLGN
jgi:hypothetical protein